MKALTAVVMRVACLVKKLRDLRGLAGPGLAADDDNGIVIDGLHDDLSIHKRGRGWCLADGEGSLGLGDTICGKTSTS